MSSNNGDMVADIGWHSQPQQQHGSEGQGSTGAAQVEGDPQAATVAAMQRGAAQGEPGQGRPAGQAQPQGQQKGTNPFYQSILEQVDPGHRAIVEPYLGKWDAGVTRRFQELYGELAPYKELGADPDTLAQAFKIYQMIDDDPQAVMNLLREVLGEDAGGQPGEQQPPQGLGTPVPGTPPGTPPAVPPELEERFKTYESVLETMAQKFLDQQGQETQQQEDAAIDQHLSLLAQEYGEFDEKYVLAQMMGGVSGEDAVKAYHQMIQAAVNQRSRMPNVPPILGGGGAVPQAGKSITDASSKDTKALVANILATSNQP